MPTDTVELFFCFKGGTEASDASFVVGSMLLVCCPAPVTAIAIKNRSCIKIPDDVYLHYHVFKQHYISVSTVNDI